MSSIADPSFGSRIIFSGRRLLRGLRRRLTGPAPLAEQVFSRAFEHNSWRGDESVSGTGSGIDQTAVVRQALPGLLHELGVKRLLDIPCGDFFWMSRVPLQGVDYVGGDVVIGLVKQNRRRYGRAGIRFETVNLLRDRLPEADMILCRDCLVHLSFADVHAALRNICQTGAEYLLTTTFTERDHNADINTGQWRVLNLQIAPFFLPAPLKIVNEQCTEDGGIYGDKSLALWRIADLRPHVAQ